MLTIDILKSNIPGLEDDQYQKIATLSQNDESKVIAEKTRNFYDDLDKDIKNVTGVDRPSSMKSYDFLKDQLTNLKKNADKVEEYKGQVTTLTNKNKDLEKSIKDGNGDESLKSRISALEKDLGDRDNTISSLRQSHDDQKLQFEKDLNAEKDKNVQYKYAANFASALAGKKFKEGIPQSAIDATISAVKSNVMAKGTPEFKKNEDGTESIIMRDDKGHVITNEKDLHNPYTASQMLLDGLSDILDGGRQLSGGGGNGSGANDTPRISGAKTKVEANRMIQNTLKERNLMPGKDGYYKAHQEMYEENNVAALPDH